MAGARAVPLLIEGSVVRFVPDLAKLNDATAPGDFLSVASGSWPDNAWLALSHSSDAGPANADVYRWSSEKDQVNPGGMRGPGWVKKYEHFAGVIELAPWHGNVVLIDTFFSVPILLDHSIHELSSSGSHLLGTTGCSVGGTSLVAPPWLHDGALSTFGYACEPESNAEWPRDGVILLQNTWLPDGKKTQERFTVMGPSLVDRVVIDDDGPAALMLHDQPPRLARLAAGRWRSVTGLPGNFTGALSSPGHSLWAVADQQLLHWRGPNWEVTPLPAGAGSAEATWLSVWERSPAEIWLIGQAKGSGQYQLFSTANNGQGAAHLPSSPELEALAESMTHDTARCSHGFANLIAQAPPQLGEDTAWPELSDEAARERLRKALLSRPRFQHLRFFSHDCYGAHCIGAMVDNQNEADALRALLPPGPYSRDDALRCLPPPATKPFAVPL